MSYSPGLSCCNMLGLLTSTWTLHCYWKKRIAVSFCLSSLLYFLFCVSWLAFMNIVRELFVQSERFVKTVWCRFLVSKTKWLLYSVSWCSLFRFRKQHFSCLLLMFFYMFHILSFRCHEKTIPFKAKNTLLKLFRSLK